MKEVDMLINGQCCLVIGGVCFEWCNLFDESVVL